MLIAQIRRTIASAAERRLEFRGVSNMRLNHGGGRRRAWIAGLQVSVGMALLAATALPALAGDFGRDEPVRHVRAGGGKVAFCTYCHGARGQGYRGYYTMPSLAGQTTEYTIAQLRAYADGRRRNPYMQRVARSLSRQARAEVASHFAHLGGRSDRGGGAGHSSLGRTIFQEGLPESNVPACAACHGMAAEGYHEVPRLAGQLPSYTERTLMTWSAERGHQGSAGIMAPVAHSLDRSQAAAVAAYLGSLR